MQANHRGERLYAQYKTVDAEGTECPAYRTDLMDAQEVAQEIRDKGKTPRTFRRLTSPWVEVEA